MNISAYLGVSGLLDTGYRFYTTAEVAVAARVTAGIVDAGDGWYSVEVTLPATAASVRWDSTGTAEAKAREYWPDPWGLSIPNGYPAGTAGKILGDNINATVSSRATPAQVATELTTYGGLKPTVAGRTLDVAAGGEAGVDWANIGAPTTTQALSGTTIATVTSLTNDPPGVTTLLARITSTLFTGITSLKEWLGLLAGKQVGNSTARTEIRSTGAGSGSFDELTDSQEALRDRGDAAWITGTPADPWATAVPGAYGAGTAGNILGNRLDVAVSTRATPAQVQTELGTYGALKPTTAGRTLDVTTTGEAGIDWANIGAPTTAQNLSATTISTVGSVTNPVVLTSAYDAAKTAATQASVNTIDDFVDTEVSAIKIVTDKLDTALELDGAVYRYTVNALENAPAGGGGGASAAAIADAVWDEPMADHLTGGSTGASLNGAGSAGDPWTTPLPGAYGAGTAGKIIGDNINATVSSRATQSSVDAVGTNVTGIKSKTDNLPVDPADASDIAASFATVNSKLDTMDTTDWTDTEKSQIRHRIGIDGDSSGPTQPPSLATQATALAIKAKTDALPADPADASDIAASFTTVNTKLDAIDDFVDTEITAIKSKTDNLPPDPASASSVTASFAVTNGKIDVVDDFLDTEIAAIQAKVNPLPSDPADASDIAASFVTVNGKLDAINGSVDTEVGAIKTVTDKLNTTLVADAAVWQYTANALELAPTGGGGGLTQADIRTAIGMASPNLDVQLTAIDDAIDTEVAAIKAKTDGLPADPASTSAINSQFAVTNGKVDTVNAAIDTEIPAIKAKTDQLTFTGGRVDANAGAIIASDLTAIADAVLKRDFTSISGEAAYSLLNAARMLRNSWSSASGVLIVKKEDGSTTAWSRPLTTNPSAEPITGAT